MIGFKDRYSKQISTLRITDIGFEDYYLIHDLACHKYNIQNPDQFYSRKGMRVAYLYAIYNDGHLNKLYEQRFLPRIFPMLFVLWQLIQKNYL